MNNSFWILLLAVNENHDMIYNKLICYDFVYFPLSCYYSCPEFHQFFYYKKKLHSRHIHISLPPVFMQYRDQATFHAVTFF